MASGDAPSGCVLVHGQAFRGSSFYVNTTTASATTRAGSEITVSLSCSERPLHPTIVFVSCPDIFDFDDNPPIIVRAVEDLILLRVLIGPRIPYVPSPNDYFVYRAGRGTDDGLSRPSLKALPLPGTALARDEVGLLRQGDEHYTVAALVRASTPGSFDLHRFRSDTGAWSRVTVSLVEPMAPFPYQIATKSSRLRRHFTSSVITVGGEGGTMGWVDLWRGILFCDVLRDEPVLREVPLPLPLDLMRSCYGEMTYGVDYYLFGNPKPCRAVTVVAGEGGSPPFLRFVHLEVTGGHTPIDATADDIPWSRKGTVSDWSVVTWSNRKMSSSWDDWIKDGVARGSSTIIPDSRVQERLLHGGVLVPSDGGAGGQKLALQNLFVSDPSFDVDMDGVVYLQARLEFLAAKAFILALDARSNKLVGAADFATVMDASDLVYFASNISRHISPEARARTLPVAAGVEDMEEAVWYEGTEHLELRQCVYDKWIPKPGAGASYVQKLSEMLKTEMHTMD